MTAVDKLLAALDEGMQPASGTYKEAMLELEKVAMDSYGVMRNALVLRGKLEVYRDLSRSVSRAADDVRESSVELLSVEATLCAICGIREARVWDDGVPYCKRCAHDKGIQFRGKV